MTGFRHPPNVGELQAQTGPPEPPDDRDVFRSGDCTTGSFTDVLGTVAALTWPHPQPSDGPPQIQCTGCRRIWVVDRKYMIDEPDSPSNHDCGAC